MQNNSVSNISFKSNIRFVPYSVYADIAYQSLSVKSVGEMFKASQLKRVKKGETNQIIQCIAGVIDSPVKDKALILHLAPKKIFQKVKNQPWYKKITSLFHKKRNNIEEISTKLKEATIEDDTKRFLIGGVSNKRGKAQGLSRKTTLEIRKKFIKRRRLSGKLAEQLKMSLGHINPDNTTAFLFQKQSTAFPGGIQSAFYFSKNEDMLLINCKELQNTNIKDGKPVDADWKDILTPKGIRNHFDYIHIAPENKVFIGRWSETPIPHELLNKRDTNFLLC